MAMARWQPLQEMLSLRDAMDRLFERSMVRSGEMSGPAGGMPMDVYCDDDHWVIEMAAPGLDPDALDISIEGNQVSVRGDYPEPSEERRYLLRERPSGHFERTIQFPSSVDTEKAEAECENGLVRLTVPRAASDRPRRVRVEGGGAQGQARRLESGERRTDGEEPRSGGQAGRYQGSERRSDKHEQRTEDPARRSQPDPSGSTAQRDEARSTSATR